MQRILIAVFASGALILAGCDSKPPQSNSGTTPPAVGAAKKLSAVASTMTRNIRSSLSVIDARPNSAPLHAPSQPFHYCSALAPPNGHAMLSVVSEPTTSPCIHVCAVSGATGLCIGCGRTLKEIASWGALSEEQRRAIMSELPARLALTTPTGPC